jgi:hypothetical protein
MPKTNALAEGLKRQSATGKKPPRAAIRSRKTTIVALPVPPSRAGRVLIAGHFAPEVQTALKIAAAEQRTTVQALLAEGINAVFARLDKPEIAAISAESRNKT